MIFFENLTIQIHRQALLKAAHLHIQPGEKVVLRGASGSGKSSLLKSAVGAIPIQDGTVRIDGVELSAETVSEIRSCVAFIGQEPVLGADQVRDACYCLLTSRHIGTTCRRKKRYPNSCSACT
jgi:putative ABC transport system ATP-binding protein